MSEDAQLLQKIADLAGAINRHKNAANGITPSYRGGGHSYRGGSSRGFSRGRGSYRGGSYRGRGGGGVYAPTRGGIAKNTWSRPPVAPSAANDSIVEIGGIKYRSSNAGSKLLRISDEEAAASQQLATPKTASLNGNSYIRSKSGNLLMKSAIKQQAKIDQPCRSYTRTGMCRPRKVQTNNQGTCKQGLSCRYQHNPKHVAVCRHYLQGKCSHAGCTLSHEPTEFNSPLCSFYERGNCSNDPCKYTHQDVHPGAKICREFALDGYCDKGARCPERHVFECPDFAATASCPREKCHLKHVHRNVHAPEPKADSTAAGHGSIDYEELQKEFETSGDEEDEDNEEQDDADSDEYDIVVDPNSTINDDFISI